MNHHNVDVVIVGAGFSGSLAAILLLREGRSVALVERGKHPRFAIGESSTPLADFKLREIADCYGLPRLKPLSQYGTWKQAYPNVMCGVKRGFSYFHHHEGKEFQTSAEHASELLVTANSSRQTADTHWLRSDVDAFLLEEAIAAGAIYRDETLIEHSESNDSIRLDCRRDGQPLKIEARFLIISTGSPQLWNQAFAVPASGQALQTRSRSLFAHFANVKPWHDVMDELGLATSDHPFPCDQAALHHVFDGGWMWQLRFDDETTSIGLLLDSHRHPINSALTTNAEWHQWLERFPSIKHQLVDATIVRPQAGLQRVDHLQHELRKVTGANWALLPAAVGFADPLFSTGIGHALFSVDRLVTGLRDLDDPVRLRESLAGYSLRVTQEIDLIDRFVSLAYRASGDFSQYVLATMPYFAAATSCEQASRDARHGAGPAFLLADNPEFLKAMRLVEESHSLNAKNASVSSIEQFKNKVADALRPFNHVGLLSPEVPRMYRHTAAK